MRKIKMYDHVYDFAEDKEIAKSLRVKIIFPEIKSGNKLQLDFNKVDGATQSFIHALISRVIVTYGTEVIDRLIFKNCNEKVKKIIEIVIRYIQDGFETDEEDK